jgi:hypothetical protein
VPDGKDGKTDDGGGVALPTPLLVSLFLVKGVDEVASLLWPSAGRKPGTEDDALLRSEKSEEPDGGGWVEFCPAPKKGKALVPDSFAGCKTDVAGVTITAGGD